MLLIQNCFAIRSFALPEDSIKTEVKKSKFAVVFGVGLVGGVRLGGIYYFNNNFSTELSYSRFGWDDLYDRQRIQYTAIINYTPTDSKHFFTSLCLNFRKKISTFPYELLIVPCVGFSSKLNRKGFGTYIRFGYGIALSQINFNHLSSDYVKLSGMPNLDIGFIYNF
jgi:hypothetical protein